MKPNEVSIGMPLLAEKCPATASNIQLFLVVHSIGIASHFQLFLDSVVSNLLSPAMGYLVRHYGSEKAADSAWETMVSSRMYGISVGCAAAIILSILMPRGLKLQTVIGTVLCIVGIVCSSALLFWDISLWPITIGRFLNGLGQGMVQTSGSVLLQEIAPLKKRGSVVAAQSMWACAAEVSGALLSLSHFLGHKDLWKWAMMVPLLPLIPALMILIRAHDSPRFFFKNGKEAEGKKALHYYQDIPDAKASEEEIMNEISFLNTPRDENSNSMKKAPYNECCSFSSFLLRFKDRLFWMPLIMGAIVQGFVHLDDWLWVSYSTQIFEKQNISTASAQVATFIMTIPQTIVSVGLLWYFESFERKTLLLIPSMLSPCIALTAAFCLGHKQWSGVPILVTFAALDLCTAAVSGESAYAIVPELFLPQDKVIGTAIVGIFQNLFGGLLTNFLLTWVIDYGVSTILIYFALANIAYVMVNAIFIPETGSKTPQEIATYFAKLKLSPFKKFNSRMSKSQAINYFINAILVVFIVKIALELLRVLSTDILRD